MSKGKVFSSLWRAAGEALDRKGLLAGPPKATVDAGSLLNLLRREEIYKAKAELYEEALAFYADPETYHGCMLMFDPPTGGFDQDISDVSGNWPEYTEKPGNRAREVLGVGCGEPEEPDCGGSSDDGPRGDLSE